MIDILDITETPLADNIVKIGNHKNKMIYVQTSKANYLLENRELIQENKNLEISWMEAVKAKKDIADTYLEIHQGKGVPLHRIITELHNGKILGSFLSYILLLSSLSLLFLIFSSFLFGINIRKVNK